MPWHTHCTSASWCPSLSILWCFCCDTLYCAMPSQWAQPSPQKVRYHPGSFSEGNFWGVGSVVLGLAFFGANILSPSLCTSTCFLQWGAWLACSICKLLQGGSCMAIEPWNQRVLSGNAGKNRTAHVQCVPIIFGASYLLLAWIAQNCLRQSLFRGPSSSPKNIFGGPEKCDQIHPRPRKEPKTQNRGPGKTFSGRAKSSPKNGNFAPDAQGQSSRKRRCLTIHVKFFLPV